MAQGGKGRGLHRGYTTGASEANGQPDGQADDHDQGSTPNAKPPAPPMGLDGPAARGRGAQLGLTLGLGSSTARHRTITPALVSWQACLRAGQLTLFGPGDELRRVDALRVAESSVIMAPSG